MSEEKKYQKDYIEEAIKKNPTLDDAGIVKIVEATLGKSPLKNYVKRIRGRMEIEKAPVEITVEKIPELDLPPEEEKKGLEIPPEEDKQEGEDLDLGIPKGKKEELFREILKLKSIGEMVGIPFRLLAERYGFEGFKLTKAEKAEIDTCTPIVNYYLPEILDKHFPLVYVGWVFLPIAINKGLDYNEWKKKQSKEEPEEST